MKKLIFITLLALAALTSCNFCNKGHKETEPSLGSWQTTPLKTYNFVLIDSIKSFVKHACTPGSTNYIEPCDRVAVFDMDGTIACEQPFSMELYCASQLAFHSVPTCTDYEDSLQDAVIAKFKSYLPDSISSDSLTSILGRYSNSTVNACIPKANPSPRVLSKQFYKPMMQLIAYLKANNFKVYIVSGSSQQFIRGAVRYVNELKGLEPSHIIGSLQTYQKLVHTEGPYPQFYLDTKNFLSNVSQGKAINIYNRIGIIPVFAFGNTVGDFDMFAITRSNIKYKTMCVLLNHDSDEMEAAYKPYKDSSMVCKNWNELKYTGIWTDSIFYEITNTQSWIVANMSECFNPDSVFLE